MSAFDPHSSNERKMKRSLWLLSIALTSLLSVGTSMATEIDGKWGLGVNVGSLLSSSAEASILRGVSSRAAWLLDVSAGLSKDKRDFTNRYSFPDTTITGIQRGEGMSISVGPRLRMFTRPQSSFSPYWDVFAHFVDRYNLGSSPGRSDISRMVGGEAGLAIGVEYFSTRWPLSVGAYTNVARLSVSHISEESSDAYSASSQSFSGTLINSAIGLSPSLQVRVYF